MTDFDKLEIYRGCINSPEEPQVGDFRYLQSILLWLYFV